MLDRRHASKTRFSPPALDSVAALFLDLSGSQVAELKEFRRGLKGALEQLRERRLILGWTIDARDLVHATVNASPSQIRYLERNA
jgi:hypothetical protein